MPRGTRLPGDRRAPISLCRPVPPIWWSPRSGGPLEARNRTALEHGGGVKFGLRKSYISSSDKPGIISVLSLPSFPSLLLFLHLFPNSQTDIQQPPTCFLVPRPSPPNWGKSSASPNRLTEQDRSRYHKTITCKLCLDAFSSLGPLRKGQCPCL